jgi:hypothetical protein
MSDSKEACVATVASDAGKVDVEAYAEAARSSVVQSMAHDSLTRITYMSVRDCRGRVFRLHHDTDRFELFSDVYDVRHIMLVPPEYRSTADYIVMCCASTIGVYSAAGQLTRPVINFDISERAIAETVICAFDIAGQVVMWYKWTGRMRVRAWSDGTARASDVRGAVVSLGGRLVIAGPGVERWKREHSLRPLTNSAYGGGPDNDCRSGENIVECMLHDARSGAVLVCTRRAVWIQDHPAPAGKCDMIYNATRDDDQYETNSAADRPNPAALSHPVDVVRKSQPLRTTPAPKYPIPGPCVNGGPRTIISCMTLEYPDTYNETVRAHLHALPKATVMCEISPPLLDIIANYACRGTCVLLADSGHRRLLRVPITP